MSCHQALTEGVACCHLVLPQAFIKARGDGVAFELNRLEVRLPQATGINWMLQPVQAAALVVDGQLQHYWRAFLQQLPNRHWAAVVRGPPSAVVDADGVSGGHRGCRCLQGSVQGSGVAVVRLGVLTVSGHRLSSPDDAVCWLSSSCWVGSLDNPCSDLLLFLTLQLDLALLSRRTRHACILSWGAWQGAIPDDNRNRMK